jgi:ABC-type metal ion transport system substrate-binding protein
MPDLPKDQNVIKTKAVKVEAQNSVKKVPSSDAAVPNNSIVSQADVPKEKEVVQEKQAEESQNIGELVNGLQKLTKELKGAMVLNVKLFILIILWC